MISVGSVANVRPKTNYFLTTEQRQFIIFIRTKQVFSLRLRSETDQIQAVYVSSEEIEQRFFPYPRFKRRNEIQTLIDAGEITVIQQGKRFVYDVCKSGEIDLSLLITKPLPNDPLYRVILNNLKAVSLPDGAPSTEYFDLFLKYKATRPELFFKVDHFAGRVHSPVSNFHRTHRPNILLNGEKTTSLDVATMQPLLLGKILTNDLVDNEYSAWINEGKDIYLELQTKANLSSRDEAKKAFFQILFSKPSNALSNLFGSADWITWVNNYKSSYEPQNPHGRDKPHSNLAWLLQTTEVRVMSKIWRKLINARITFIPVHDEIIVPVSKALQAMDIMKEVLSGEFEYSKISWDKAEIKDVLTATLSTLPTLTGGETPTAVQKSLVTASQIPTEIKELHTKYVASEQIGELDNHPDREQIRTLWQAVGMYAYRPSIQSLYTDRLEAIINNLSHTNQ